MTDASQPEAPASIARRLRPVLGSLSESEWPSVAWQELAAAHVTGWTIAADFGGAGFTQSEVLEGALELARSHLGLTFVLSQFQAAASRIQSGENDQLKQQWLPQLASGKVFATVGISQLTTSRSRTGRAAMLVEDSASGEVLNGFAPWVTGAAHAQLVVLGGVTSTGEQRLYAVPTRRPGVSIEATRPLLALNGSDTARVNCAAVPVSAADLISVPPPQSTPTSMGAGSLMTSALALGHAYGAIDHYQSEVQEASATAVLGSLKAEADQLREVIQSAASGTATASWTTESIRAAATSLAIRATQSFLAASRGAGFVAGHPAERLVREALFFLVWSCPQGVASRLLQEFSRCETVDLV